MKITQIYNGFKDEELVVDKTYQRKKVWGDKDNIRLIETILLDLVIPEIFMWVRYGSNHGEDDYTYSGWATKD